MNTAQLEDIKQPFSIRYPRGCGNVPNWRQSFSRIRIGEGRQLTDGDDIALLTIGKSGLFAQDAIKQLAGENISVAHYDLRFVKPLDEKMLNDVFLKFSKIITVEDGVIKGGFGSAILEFMAQNGFSAQVKLLGIPDRFIEHGSLKELYKICGIDTEGIVNAAHEMIGK